LNAQSIEDAIIELKGIGARRIMLQIPDGLKPEVFNIFGQFSTEFDVVISGEPFYGACDLGNFSMEKNIDAVVQFGHSVMPNVVYPVPVIFLEWKLSRKIDFSQVSLEQIDSKGYRKIGLLCSIQYCDQMDSFVEMMKKKGYTIFIGNVDRRMSRPGQVLGCNFSAAHSVSSNVDCFIVVSTGVFHSIGVQLSTDRETFLLDLNSMTLRSMKSEAETFLRKRYARIEKALDARKFCVAMNTKVGQRRDRLALLIQKKLTELGKESVMVTTDNVVPSDFVNMRCDAVIFTGCPRVSLDDQEKFPMPVLTPPEFLRLFGFKQDDRYIMDEIVSVS